MFTDFSRLLTNFYIFLKIKSRLIKYCFVCRPGRPNLYCCHTVCCMEYLSWTCFLITCFLWCTVKHLRIEWSFPAILTMGPYGVIFINLLMWLLFLWIFCVTRMGLSYIYIWHTPNNNFSSFRTGRYVNGIFAIGTKTYLHQLNWHTACKIISVVS